MNPDRATGQAGSEAEPDESRLPVGYLDDALVLLKRINRLRFRDGGRLSAAAEIGGFETWWFVQHRLLWSFLVPYCRHRARFQAMLSGEPAVAGELSPDARRICGQLGLPLTGEPESGPAAASAWMRLLGRLSQLGLLAFSLISLLVFRVARRDTLFYVLDHVSPGLDHDFRLSPIYAELRRRGYRHAEYVQARGFEDCYRETWRNILRRRRPLVVVDMVIRLASKLPGGEPGPRTRARDIELDAADAEGAFLAAVAAWTATQAQRQVFETRVLRRLFRLHGARRAVMVDHNAVIGQLVAACRLNGIPTLGFMHGNFTRFNSGLMAYGFGGARRHTFDLYGVWTDHYRERLLAGDLYDKTNTFASGPLRAPDADLVRRVAATRDRARRPVHALLISEKYAPRDEVEAFARELAADPRIRLKLKLRLGEQAQLAVNEEDREVLQIEPLRTSSVYEALAHCDVVIGTHSTVLYEAVLGLRPVVVLGTSFTYGNDMVREGLADFAPTPESACAAVLRAHSLPDAELTRRKSTLWGDKLVDGAKRLFDVAERELWRPPRDDSPAGATSCG